MQAETDMLLSFIEGGFQQLAPPKQIELLKALIGDLVRKRNLSTEQANNLTQAINQVETPTVMAPQGKRIAGLHQGQGWISDDFDDELPDEFWGDRV